MRIVDVAAFTQTGGAKVRVILGYIKSRSSIGLPRDRETAKHFPLNNDFHDQPWPSIFAAAPDDLRIVNVEALHHLPKSDIVARAYGSPHRGQGASWYDGSIVSKPARIARCFGYALIRNCR